jgi:HK97 family phage major capsid protein
MDPKAKKKPTVKDYQDAMSRLEKAEEAAKELERLKAGNLIMVGGTPDNPARVPEVHTTSRVGSAEQKALASFGCRDVRGLLTVNTGSERFKWVDEATKKMVVNLKHEFETARIIAQLFYDQKWDHVGVEKSGKTDRFARLPSMMETYYFKNMVEPKLKAFGTGVSGGGAEWIPTAIASTYISEFELIRQIVGAVKQVNMPTSPYELPTNTFTTARKGTENVTATDSSFTTDVLQFNAKKFLEYYIFPEELNEDSAPDIVALGRSELSEAHERAFETSMINGTEPPTAHIDSDTDAGAADLAEKQYDGLRKLAIDNSANGATTDFGNAIVSDANLRLMRARLGKLGVNPNNLLWIPGSTSYLQMLGTDNVVTVDKMGNAATILKGMLGAYQGIPIMQTGFMREDLNATGVHDGITVDRTGILLIHRSRWYFGTRRPIRLAIRPSRSADDRIEMASYSRVEFLGHPQTVNETELGVSYGFNIST